MLVEHLDETFQKEECTDLRQDPQALHRLTEAAEKTKIELSSSSQSEINLPFITATDTGPKQLNITVTRAKFEKLSSGLIERCKQPVVQCLQDAGIQSSDIDAVVMVGGSSMIPSVQELVRSLTGKDLNQTVNPSEVLAVEAAIQGGVVSGEVKDILLRDPSSPG